MTSKTDLNEALAANFVLVDLQQRSWSGKRTDRDASDELLSQKHATRDGGAFVKNLLASAGQELKAVHTMGNALRTFVYNRTLPWSSSEGSKRGARVLATSQAMDFLNEIATLKKDYDRTVRSLVDAWPVRVAEAMRNLGALADASDYPVASDLPAMFAVHVDLIPIPAVSDFSRLNVPAALADALGQRHAMAAEARVANAMDELRGRFVEELERINTQMTKVATGEKTRVYESLITNMQTLVQMARHMNLTGNPKLDEIVSKIERKMLQFPVSVYKEDIGRAAALAQEAREVAAEIGMDDVWM